jgi:hypothetical protein
MLASDGVRANGGWEVLVDLGFVTTAMTVSSLFLYVLVATSTVLCADGHGWPLVRSDQPVVALDEG